MRVSRTKVKSGCRTCKVRRVKCDNCRLACMRCVPNGRVCEGYGIWEGGNVRASGNSQPDAAKTLAIILAGGTSWKPTTYILPRMKLKDDKNNLVVRASSHEPPVFHAMLALSSLHKKTSIGTLVSRPERDVDQSDLFSLRHYTKAIHELLQPQITDKNNAAVRSTLVACILFIHIESLCGRLKIANHHLESGMKVLPRLVEYTGSNREPADTWLIGTLTRMNLAALQLGQGYLLHMPPIAKVERPLPCSFETLGQGRDIMDTILSEVMYLTANSGEDTVEGQEHIKNDLAGWISAYKAFQINLQGTPGPLAMLASGVLLFHCPMVKMMADTYLRTPGDEMVCDAYTPDFASMVTSAGHFLQLVATVHRSGDPVFKTISVRIYFTSDIGWCPHLYYTALDCRVSSIRWRAIELLRSIPTREGIWYSSLVASAAHEVILMEGETPPIAGFIREYPKDYVDAVPVDPLEPLPPAWRRVYDVRVIMPDRLVLPCKATLVCKRHNFATSCGHEEITREFDVIGTSG